MEYFLITHTKMRIVKYKRTFVIQRLGMDLRWRAGSDFFYP